MALEISLILDGEVANRRHHSFPEEIVYASQHGVHRVESCLG